MYLRSLLGLAFACAFSLAHAIELVSPDNQWTFDDTIKIPTPLDPSEPNSELIQLPANIFVPTSSDADATYPAIIFVSSWAINEYEYLTQAQHLAEQGYIVLSYTARGFWSSPGAIDTAGEADVSDCSRAIDYLLDPNNHLPIDPNGIGLGGISYGAGISLLTTMVDERVKAVASMSGWGDLIESLWAGNTPNYTWLEILTLSSQPIPFIARNNPDPIIEKYYGFMREHSHVEEVKAWGYIRSPNEYLGYANARANKPAIFTSNNLHDYLFQPNSIVRMLSHYEGPWRAEFNVGTHAQAEGGALLGIDGNRIWEHVELWFDHYLKGIDNGIETKKPVTTVVLGGSKLESYEKLDYFDTELHYNLNPLAGEQGGELNTAPEPDFESVLSFDTTERVTYSGWVGGAVVGNSWILDTNKSDLTYGLMFKSAPLEETLHLRGAPKISFWAYAEDKTQYFAYLFALNPETGRANWVGHAPFSCHQSEGCGLNPDEPSRLTLDFYWTSVNLPKGYQVLLVIDGKDNDYWRYPTTPEQNTLIISPEYPAEIVIPAVSKPSRYDDPAPPKSDKNDISRGANGSGDGLRASGGSLGLLLMLTTLLLGWSRRRFV